MAYKDSDQLKIDNTGVGGYDLGAYEFSIRITPDPGETTTGINVRCYNSKTGETARVSAEVSNATIDGWYVEANETEASVYVKIKQSATNPWDMPPFEPAIVSQIKYSSRWTQLFSQPVHAVADPSMSYAVTACDSPFTIDNMQGSMYHAVPSTHYGKTVYAYFASVNGQDSLPVFEKYFFFSTDKIAWQMIYGSFEEEEDEILVARFAIDTVDAGAGPEDSYEDPDDWEDWDDPEDYDPEEDPIEWGDPDYPDPDDPDYPDPIEPGEPGYPDPDDPDYPGDEDGDGEPDPYHPDYDPPQKTLQLTVTGANTGTHAAGSIPSSNGKEADYGCGGDGGHGGGGGAGASTVIIHKFATSKANNKEVTAIARPHGYGSGGGKGGKGGDGCILVYW